MESPRPLFALF
jgi:hypothetical protein